MRQHGAAMRSCVLPSAHRLTYWKKSAQACRMSLG
jgi:hypothetical protein